MPSIEYDTIYKRALVRIEDIDLSNYTQSDFSECMIEWLHSSAASPIFRKMFASFSLDDDLEELKFELNNPIDDEYDTNYVTNLLSKGIVINYMPRKIETSKELEVMVYGKEEKVRSNYKTKMQRLHDLQIEYNRELTQHSYYFGNH